MYARKVRIRNRLIDEENRYLDRRSDVDVEEI